MSEHDHKCEECGKDIFPYCDACGKEVRKLKDPSDSLCKALEEGWTLISFMNTHRCLLCPECSYGKCSRCGTSLLLRNETHLMVLEGVFMMNIHYPFNDPDPPFNGMAFCVDCFADLTAIMKPFMEEKKVKN